ncbi:filamentous hemagglutinin N-terminal domain-containing protein [Paraburkholderia sp. MPAMCS5]|uniref:two-partner secretion domain-containing protein n=1 Tax=Paraburkholderia sp. MPAMCS5 TaxID=3112563 RepID=UPI002E186093|nr:filamentous hemagglutinin N-terminal domain-containing protein [Paraburkholderia sp. MPAMCS5]
MSFRLVHPCIEQTLRRCIGTRPRAIVIALSLAGFVPASVAIAAGVLPQGGQYVSGQGSINTSGNNLVVTQPGSTRGVIEWGSFSIGRNNAVTFENGSGATLNRVTGGSLSAILGKLSATGDLYLINPQGVVVGPSGIVSTGGRFMASTLDVCDSAFMNGGALSFAGDSNASVVNLGKISSSGGDVFLIAREAVVNAGSVAAPNGTAEFGVGANVLLQDSSSSKQLFVQTGSQGTIANLGPLQAAQIDLQAADGNIYALAGGGTRMRATGTATRDGHVWLVADTGSVMQGGTIAALNTDGSGGTVDTQALNLSFGRGARVLASQWNVASPAFTIDVPAARAFRRSLGAGTSVNVTTTGANGATGDLDVASNLNWQGSAALSLAAYHHVFVAPGITLKNTGAGNLTLRADASGIDNGGSVINGGTLDWSASTGTLSALYDMNGSYSPGTILTNSAWTAAPYSGLLTQATAYKLIDSLDDLQQISTDLAGTYALGKDIDASATAGYPPAFTFTSLGNGATPFTGQFDGMGHAISNLTPTGTVLVAPGAVTGGPDQRASGLFGVIGAAGVVRNVSVNGHVNNEEDYGSYGILAGFNYGLVTYARASGSASTFSGFAYTSSVGGLVGYNDGTITRSGSSVAVSAEGMLGGLVGINAGTIRQSYATGSVAAQAHTEGGGGLVGVNTGLVSQSYATGQVSFQPNYCGGGGGSTCTGGSAALVQRNDGTIEQSFATGQVIQQIIPTLGPPALGVASANNGTIAGDVFWDTQTTRATRDVYSGTGTSAAQGLTTAQMSTPSSFGPTYDFSTTGTWAMPAGATHPVLRWELAQ